MRTELRGTCIPLVDGEYLKSLGLKAFAAVQAAANAVRDARLDGEIHTLEEETTTDFEAVEEHR